MTNATFYLEQVKLFRDACGIHQVDNDLHLNLLDEESKELALASARNDRAQIADGFADCLVVYCGWELDGNPPIPYSDWIKTWVDKCRVFQIDLLPAFEIVHKSNMSKLCTEADIQPTIRKYDALDVEIEWKNPSDGLFAPFAANDTEHAPRGKLLKGIGYQSPGWESTREQWDMMLWK